MSDPRFFSNGDTLRQLERLSIRAFMERHAHLLRGRVLDFGAGKPGTCALPQPYRDLVVQHADATYVPWEPGEPIPSPSWDFDVLLCTQVLQYVASPVDTMSNFTSLLRIGGILVLTYPTTWPCVEEKDKWRFTAAGITELLRVFNFEVVEHVSRVNLVVSGNVMSLGGGVVARRV